MNLIQNQVYSMKLNSGEEVIAKIVSVDETTVTLSEPVSVAPGPKGIGLMPSMFTADTSSEVTLNKSSISLCGLTDDSVKTKYIEATTGISVPDKKIIMG